MYAASFFVIPMKYTNAAQVVNITKELMAKSKKLAQPEIGRK